ncbi:carbohydrate ABC transporter permease [Burkholderia pseudomallei]|nr:carbohydrate ABC transporter permease [Burkholderia pseudomallei]CAJ6277636.1 carbohydrate ABC transporter permease [Burkholderia pseudomallei]CAJ8332721.1 carbohydrate ABC transporter permease [Burkholderia pseudomallei]CAJ8346517.1 carbohydrate ABC transporter permease [Burkholderia pseudomallei]
MNMHDRTAAPSASCAPAAASPARATGPARAAHALAALRRSTTFYPLVGLVAVCVAMVFASDSFLSAANLENVLRQVSINAIIGVGVALGAANGLFVAFAGMPPIIVTLATMGIARGLALIYTGGYPIDGLPDWVRFFGSGKVLGVQMPVLTMLAVYALAWLMLERMPFGRYVYAIGGNEHATRLSGVRVSRVKLAVYTFAGLTSALAALVLTGRLMSGQPNAGGGFELDAIAAVVMGGTSIAGGRGSIVGTLVGALLLGVLNNGLNMIGVNPYVQNVIKGAIILLAIYIGRERRT